MAEFIDPFLMLRALVSVKFNDYTSLKLCNILLITIYSLIHCLLIHYMFKNLDINLAVRYVPMIMFLTLVIVGAIFSVAIEKDILEAQVFLFKANWSLEMIRKDAQLKLERKCRIINICILCVLLLIFATITINAPLFGSQRELFICIQVFEEYFGKWSFIPYYFYFAAFPFLYYDFLKLWMSFVYAVLEVQLQLTLVEEYLFETYQINSSKEWKNLQDTHYQQQIKKSLRLCITHHIALKKFVKMTVDLTIKVMPFYLTIGVLILISFFSFIINFADSMSNILKIRIFMFSASIVSITVLLSWIGQQLVDVTSGIFWSLVGAPWYFWNLENVKTLLIFLMNCTKNESIVLAGICIDYSLGISILRLSVSYALGLFNLRKSSLD
ncbi:odorant receptor 214 [Tribolium castaneum]|uniref:Odorant receptor n=1 Tax=Tribolium castaneum TaxID=7070 RepID=D6WHL1_TRICA|nr:odorant receptor 214 [Tribolium castaneum]